MANFMNMTVHLIIKRCIVEKCARNTLPHGYKVNYACYVQKVKNAGV